MKLQWSYSSLKTFLQCPKKYYHLKVARDIQDSPGEAANYGKIVHKAAEDYIRDAVPVPEKFAYVRPILDALNRIEGEKFCEIEMGIKIVDGVHVACDFDDPDYWWHGIADLLVVKGEVGYLVDYKTNKNARYADTKQLDLLAVAAFLRYPELQKIKSALLFVVSNDFINKEHHRDNFLKYLDPMRFDLERLEKAFEHDVWNPVSGPLCKFCPVKSCIHNS